MKKKLEIFQIDVFTDLPFKGNPAAVTFGDNLSNQIKLLIAREMNLSETAFISKSNVADFKLQWFTPTSEVKICGHATIATLHFLQKNNLLRKNKQVKFETLSGVLNCYQNKNNYYMQLPIPKLSIYTKSKKELLEILELRIDQQVKQVPFVIVNKDTCYISVKNLNTLKNIQPDYNKLRNFGSRNKQFRVIVVYTLETFEKNNFAHSRCFAPYLGINEDPVTGSTNGPLLLVLKKFGLINQSQNTLTLSFEQGDFMGRNGRVTVIFNKLKNELYISGKAVTIMKGNLFI